MVWNFPIKCFSDYFNDYSECFSDIKKRFEYMTQIALVQVG